MVALRQSFVSARRLPLHELEKHSKLAALLEVVFVMRRLGRAFVMGRTGREWIRV